MLASFCAKPRSLCTSIAVRGPAARFELLHALVVVGGLGQRAQRERDLVVLEAVRLQVAARRVLHAERRRARQPRRAVFPGGGGVLLAHPDAAVDRGALAGVELGDVVEDDLAVVAHDRVGRDRQVADQAARAVARSPPGSSRSGAPTRTCAASPAPRRAASSCSRFEPATAARSSASARSTPACILRLTSRSCFGSFGRARSGSCSTSV